MCLSHHQVCWLLEVTSSAIQIYDFMLFAVPVVISQLQISSGSHCLLNGTSVNIQCVNSGFPRPEIIFFRGTQQITPGTGSFSNFEAVEGEFDTVRLTTAQQEDGGEYVCVARMRNTELDRSLPNTLLFCSRCWIETFSLYQVVIDGQYLCVSLPQLCPP